MLEHAIDHGVALLVFIFADEQLRLVAPLRLVVKSSFSCRRWASAMTRLVTEMISGVLR
jgi:hypothetical protein